MKQKILSMLGLERKTPYVRNYFYAANMRASIYMSAIVIVLEIWMIFRMIKTVIINQITGDSLTHVIDRYFTNYFILLSAGILMLLYALRFKRGYRRTRWLSLISVALCIPVILFEIRTLSTTAFGTVEARAYTNYIVLLCAGILLLIFAGLLLRNKEDQKRESIALLYLFSIICLNFGIIFGANSYAKGEQILAFLTMEIGRAHV